MSVEEELKQTEVERIVDLYQLDYSIIAQDPGNPSFFEHFTPNLMPDGTKVVFQAVTYEAIPVQARGFEKTATTQAPRPTLLVANGDGLLSTLTLTFNDLVGARLTRRRIFERHLDAGSDPNPAEVWEPSDLWIVARKIQENFLQIEWELRAPSDIEQYNIPNGTVERNLCRWRYKDEFCTWVPGAGPYFLRDGTNTLDALLDDCGLRVSDCRLRFADPSRNETLRIASFPSAGRVVR